MIAEILNPETIKKAISRLTRDGEKVNCFTVANLYRELTGGRVDHHEVAFTLDDLSRAGYLKVVSQNSEVINYAFAQ